MMWKERTMAMNQKWMALLMTGSLLTGAGGTYAAMTWKDAEAEVPMQSQTEAKTVLNLQAEKDPDANEVKMDKVVQAFQLIKGSYVEDVKEEQLVEGAIQGMLTTLDDPYSVYMDQEKAKQFNDMLDSSFEGIGAEVSMVD